MKLRKAEFRALEASFKQRLDYLDAYLWQNMDDESEALMILERAALRRAWKKVRKDYELQSGRNTRKGQSLD